MPIHHLAIWTSDLEGLKIFYETYFQAQAGAKYTNPTKGFESYFLDFGAGTRLEIMRMAGIPQMVGERCSSPSPIARSPHAIHEAV